MLPDALPPNANQYQPAPPDAPQCRAAPFSMPDAQPPVALAPIVLRHDCIHNLGSGMVYKESSYRLRVRVTGSGSDLILQQPGFERIGLTTRLTLRVALRVIIGVRFTKLLGL